ncbi:SIR2 family protein [Agrobacterium tumefaciens]|uniref:SIR2 family protein n=1 Tax=Agrobacterium tumefaciens TaxID=358 RepID=UPI00287E7B99|nr:SIR2 family protein [Agrobacterium tumefaciens]MDS7597453.1 SIR2 family protein [Agrobacterium tumefaciens]
MDALTDAVLKDFVGDEKAAVDAIRASLPQNGNIENILSKVRLMQTALGDVKANGLDGDGYKALGEKICEGIGKIVGAKLPNARSAFHELVAWIAGAQRPHSVELFTTNYDLLFETALEAAKVPYFDGFSGGHAPFFDPVTVAGDDLPARWVRLWKMHGSLGWMVENGRVVRTGSYDSTELIYPDHLKYDLTQKQPYAALFERLKRFLMTPDTLLLTTGFSFRDAHICAVIDEALAVNANTSVFAFQFLDLNSEQPACKLAYDRPNVSVYASDGAVINGVAGKWRLGDPPKNWSEIRSSFWGQRWGQGDPVFLLGDFATFCRFLAISYSADVAPPAAPGT